jgi:hypothetical protein
MGIKGTTWNKIISASKVLANFSAWSNANLAKSEPSKGTKIFLYIPHLPQSIFYPIYINFSLAWQQKRSEIRWPGRNAQTCPASSDFLLNLFQDQGLRVKTLWFGNDNESITLASDFSIVIGFIIEISDLTSKNFPINCNLLVFIYEGRF